MKQYIYIGLLAFGAMFVAGCNERELDGMDGQTTAPVADPTQIDPSCSLVSVQGVSAQPMSRGLVGQTTVATLEGNFIQISESLAENATSESYTPTEFASWESANIVHSKVFSSPDDTDGIYFRSLVLEPRLTYTYRYENEDTETVPVAGITRMVGWYPRTYDIPKGADGKPALGNFKESGSYEVLNNGEECVVFKEKLNGETDIMMTDMREGRMLIDGFKNNESDRDVQPYGYMRSGNNYQYCNYFTFNHYLTAVRLYIRVQSSDLSLISWKQIDDVVFTDQPSTVVISLPKGQAREENQKGSSLVYGTTPTLPAEGVEPIFGEAKEWRDPKNMSIIKTAMSDDPNYTDFSEVPSYPIPMEHAVVKEKTYLGYMMIQPDKDTEVEIHTDAGVFHVTIPREVTVTGADGTPTTNSIILQPSWIYDIVIDMKADGVLDVVVGNEDFESFKDLSPYNNTYHEFEYSNCFLIDQDRMKDEEGNWYNGFYFHAMTAGRGENGVINNTGDDLYPKNIFFDPQKARILWQSEPSLVTNVELIHGYVRFSLHEDCRNETNPKQGNTVIAVYDDAGNILWTWHIWVVNGVKDISYTIQNAGDSGAREIKVMNMNLGATSGEWTDADDVLKTYGLYYQWGRKDPSPGPPAYNYEQQALTTAPFYYLDEGVRDYVKRFQVSEADIQDAILYPLELIATSFKDADYHNDWLFRPIDYLWGGGITSFTKKTIYDPCPYGYRVAFDELNLIFNDAKIKNKQNANSGYEMSETSFGCILKNGNAENYFPYAGWKGHDRGRTDDTHAWYYVGKLGDYQDARISDGSDINGKYYNNHRGRTFLIYNPSEYKPLNVFPEYTDDITLDYANRSSASPVRCVRYDAFGEEPDANEITSDK